MLSGLDHLRRSPNFPYGDLQNAVLLQALRYADEFIKGYCGRRFEWGLYTEYFDANSRDYLLGEWPVSFGEPTSDPVIPKPRLWFDVDGLYGQADGAFASDTEMTYGTDFLVLPGSAPGVLRIFPRGYGRSWSNWSPNSYGSYDYGTNGPTYGSGAVKVAYWAGWKPGQVPEDIMFAEDQIATGFITSNATGGSAAGLVLLEEQLGQARVKFGQTSSGSSSSSSSKTTTKSIPLIGSMGSILGKYRKTPIG